MGPTLAAAADNCDAQTANRENECKWATRDFLQGRRLARLGLGTRRDALKWAAHRSLVWLFCGLLLAECRDEAWLKKGLPCS